MKTIALLNQKGGVGKTTTSERKENVKDKYEIIETYNVSNKHIILIDDIRTSGATIDELVNLLYKNNAKMVSVIVLASNQMIDIGGNIKYFKCEKCGNYMKLRINSKNNKCFWSCNHHNCKTLDYLEGVKKFKKVNSKLFKTENDIEF